MADDFNIGDLFVSGPEGDVVGQIPKVKGAKFKTTLQAGQVALLHQLFKETAKQSQVSDELFSLLLPQLERQRAELEAFNAAVPVEDQADFYRSQFESALSNQAASDEILQLQLENLRRGGVASPEQAAIIERLTQEGLASGTSDIDAFVEEGLDQIADELANSRGMRFGDTPILDRGNLLAREGLRQKSQLGSQLRQAALQGLLGMGQFSSQANLAQQNLSNSIAQFQRGLRDSTNNQGLLGGFQFTGNGLSGLQGFDVGQQLQMSARPALRGQDPFWQRFLLAGAPQITQGGTQGIGAGIVAGLGCWCAAEYFGWFTPKWWSARRWIMQSEFRDNYLRHGEALARKIRLNPALKEALRPFFETAALLGA